MKNCPVVELLTEIRDRLRDLDTLEELRAMKAAQQARYRAKKRAEILCVDTTQCVDTTKEAEKGKENFPPAPPIREKGKGEEKEEEEEPRARERNAIPTLEKALRYASMSLGDKRCPPEVVREWFAARELGDWMDGHGNPIHNWGLNLAAYAQIEKRRKEEAERAAKGETPITRKADNWRGTRKEFLSHVLG